MTELLSQIYTEAGDRERFVDILDRLARHLATTPIVTGSFAVEWQIAVHGGRARSRELHDIDVVAVNGVADIRPSISKEFLVNHYHPSREAGNLLLQLADVPWRTQIDVFSPRSSSIAELSASVQLGDADLLVASAEDLAARLLGIIAIVIEGKRVDPKYVDGFERVSAVSDERLAHELWKEYKWGSFTGSFAEIRDAARRAIKSSPELLRENAYSKDTSLICPSCVADDPLALADKSVILETLGYV